MKVTFSNSILFYILMDAKKNNYKNWYTRLHLYCSVYWINVYFSKVSLLFALVFHWLLLWLGGAGGKGVWGAAGMVYEMEEPDAKDPNYDESSQVSVYLHISLTGYMTNTSSSHLVDIVCMGYKWCHNICNSSPISMDIMYCLNHQCQLKHLELGLIVQRDS